MMDRLVGMLFMQQYYFLQVIKNCVSVHKPPLVQSYICKMLYASSIIKKK